MSDFQGFFVCFSIGDMLLSTPSPPNSPEVPAEYSWTEAGPPSLEVTLSGSQGSAKNMKIF